MCILRWGLKTNKILTPEKCSISTIDEWMRKMLILAKMEMNTKFAFGLPETFNNNNNNNKINKNKNKRLIVA